MKTALIITHSCDPGEIFRERGWNTVYVTSLDSLDAYRESLFDGIYDYPDLLVFTGGADLNPQLYGEVPDGAYGWNDGRDALEVAVYRAFSGRAPMAGICRGAQLLTVMNGGRLIQHKEGHSGDHPVQVWQEGGVGGVESIMTLRECHHQCLLPSGEEGVDYYVVGRDIRDDNIEIVYFPEERALAFQGHPEWGCATTESLFFELLEEYIGV